MTRVRGIPDQGTSQWKATVLLLVLWLVLSTASYFLVVVPRGQRFDFFPRWVGSRAVLRGESPYSDEITWRIQEGMFGRRLQPGEDQQRFAYSATITWPLLPFWLLPFALSVSLWIGLQFLLLLVLPVWVVSILGWRIRPAPLIMILIFSIVVYRYPVNAYLIGQFLPFSLACLVAGWWGLIRGQWIVTSVALILAMVRPEVIVFPLLALLIMAWERGYRRILVTWLAGMMGLWFLTRIWIGPWERDFIRGIEAYQAYSSPIWPPNLLNLAWLAPLIVIGILGWSVWMWREMWFLNSSERPGWIISVAALTTLVVLPQTGNYTLILALLPAWVILWVSRRRYVQWIPVMAVLASPWIFLVLGDGPSAMEHLIIPLSLATLLTFHWRQWKRGAEESGSARAH